MAARKAALRAVREGEQPQRKAPARLKSVIEAAETGDRRELLVAMRRRIAVAVDGSPPPHALAPLTRLLRELDVEIRLADQCDEDDLEVEDELFNPAEV